MLLQIDLEAYGKEIDFEQLEGLWRLIYTTALSSSGSSDLLQQKHSISDPSHFKRCLSDRRCADAGTSGHASKPVFAGQNRQHISKVWLLGVWAVSEHHQSQCAFYT